MFNIDSFIKECKNVGAIRFATDSTKYQGGKHYNKCVYVFNEAKQLIGSYSKNQGVIYNQPKSIEYKERTFVDLSV